ncbi:hypothetical protein G6O67_004970 [Ophiocordyceps sinensis]|uniref:Uncharacterized protein n=1 Tax=Ophiocordyceps sinensis TaxID=72228 RepID=A0A8H4PQL8_9HYPO|nr:hypothetical protein G6O67_004970 [Ophiocordyceps sinensis]
MTHFDITITYIRHGGSRVLLGGPRRGVAHRLMGAIMSMLLTVTEDGGSGEQVDREVAEAYATGLKGVPKFIINGTYEVDGAEDMSGFLEQLVAAMDAAEGGVAVSEGGMNAMRNQVGNCAC